VNLSTSRISFWIVSKSRAKRNRFALRAFEAGFPESEKSIAPRQDSTACDMFPHT
jgi:hypothetical protein